MKTSSKGIELIQQFEGLRLKAYRDSGGIWTIGYGHTGGVKSGEVITTQQANDYLIRDLEIAEEAINDLHLTQNQFDALVSFIFNVGCGNFERSTLRKKLIKNTNDPTIPNEFRKWIYITVNGVPKPSSWQVKRRNKEADVYQNGNYE